MKTLFAGALVVAAIVVAGPGLAQVRSGDQGRPMDQRQMDQRQMDHRYMGHHSRMRTVCWVRHGHRVCHMERR